MKEAVELLEKTNTVKFDPTVEVHFNLNLDPKYSEQMIRTTISLPNGSGKSSKICAFTEGNANELLNAGANIGLRRRINRRYGKMKNSIGFGCLRIYTMNDEKPMKNSENLVTKMTYAKP